MNVKGLGSKDLNPESSAAATRRRMLDMDKPAALRKRALRAASFRSLFIYTILIGNCFGIASLVSALKPEHLSDHAYTLCVSMIDIEIFLIFLLAFFINYTDGHLTRPLYEQASSIWEDLATRDTLTGLPNRLAFMHALDDELNHGRKTRTRCAVLFIDLNRFKQVNDTFGHAAGDAVLSTAAQRIYQSLTPRDVAARLGGDEFAVLLPNVTMGRAQHIADEIERNVRIPIIVDEKNIVVTASVGIRMSDERSKRAEELLHDADVKMYKAKAAVRWQRADNTRMTLNPQFVRNPKRP